MGREGAGDTIYIIMRALKGRRCSGGGWDQTGSREQHTQGELAAPEGPVAPNTPNTTHLEHGRLGRLAAHAARGAGLGVHRLLALQEEAGRDSR